LILPLKQVIHSSNFRRGSKRQPKKSKKNHGNILYGPPIFRIPPIVISKIFQIRAILVCVCVCVCVCVYIQFRTRVLWDTLHFQKDVDKYRLIGEKRARGISVK